MDIKANHIALLRLLEDGAYGTEIPDDDATSETLSDLEQMGLIQWESARLDDFYYPSKAGLTAIAAAARS